MGGGPRGQEGAGHPSQTRVSSATGWPWALGKSLSPCVSDFPLSEEIIGLALQHHRVNRDQGARTHDRGRRSARRSYGRVSPHEQPVLLPGVSLGQVSPPPFDLGHAFNLCASLPTAEEENNHTWIAVTFR